MQKQEGVMDGLQTRDLGALRYLLSETLFLVDDQKVESEPDELLHIPDLTFHGRNGSGILFLCEEPQAEWMPDAAMDAFHKSLAALKLSMQDVVLVNTGKLTAASLSMEPKALLSHLLSQFKPVKVILLGVNPNRFSITEQSLPMHTPTQLQEVTWLRTYSFSDMLDDVNKKRAYWNSIKALLV